MDLASPAVSGTSVYANGLMDLASPAVSGTSVYANGLRCCVLVHRHKCYGELFFLYLHWGQISHELLYLSAKFRGVTSQKPLAERSLVYRWSALGSSENLRGRPKDINKKISELSRNNIKSA